MSLTLSEYRKYDGLGLAELVAAGEVQASELIEIAIKCIEESNPEYNAVINKMYDLARLQIKAIANDSKFFGVPFLLKDLIVDYAGVATSNGSELTKNLIPNCDSELVRRYKQAGLIILGKTNTPEFGLAPVTEPELFGPTRSPWNVELTPGGSSGGSAAAIASGMVPIAHANDGGGSIRIPAAYCGLFGMKPSRGRMPTGPVLGKLIQGLVVEHVLTRTVRDSAAILDATAGPDIGAPLYAPGPQTSYLTATLTDPKPLRIGFTTQPFINVDVDSHYKNTITNTAKLCADLGHHVEEVSLDKLSIEDLYAVWVIFCGETAATISELCLQNDIRFQNNKLETSTLLIYQFGRSLSAADFAKASHRLDSVTRKVAN